MGLYSLELWLLRLKKERRELDVLPILRLLGFCLNWFGLGLFCFLLFLIMQTELICSQLWKIWGTMKHPTKQLPPSHLCCAAALWASVWGRMGKLEKPGDTSGWENLVFPR